MENELETSPAEGFAARKAGSTQSARRAFSYFRDQRRGRCWLPGQIKPRLTPGFVSDGDGQASHIESLHLEHPGLFSSHFT